MGYLKTSMFLTYMLYLYFPLFLFICFIIRASLVTQMVKHLLTKWEILVRSLGWEDPLEKEMPFQCSSCLENPMDRRPW